MSWSFNVSGHQDNIPEEELAVLEQEIVHEFEQIKPHLVERLAKYGLHIISFSGNSGFQSLHTADTEPTPESLPSDEHPTTDSSGQPAQ